MAKLCPHCGGECDDLALICPHCGRTTSRPERETQYDPAQPDGQASAPWTRGEGQLRQPARQRSNMKWFYFVQLQLLLSAILNTSSALLFFMGDAYDELILQYYDVVPALRHLEIYIGIALLILAASAIYVRAGLRHFRRGSPILYLLLLVGNAVVNFADIYVPVWILNAVGIHDLYVDAASAIPTVVTSVAMVVLNAVYFYKRRARFRN